MRTWKVYLQSILYKSPKDLPVGQYHVDRSSECGSALYKSGKAMDQEFEMNQINWHQWSRAYHTRSFNTLDNFFPWIAVILLHYWCNENTVRIFLLELLQFSQHCLKWAVTDQFNILPTNNLCLSTRHCRCFQLCIPWCDIHHLRWIQGDLKFNIKYCMRIPNMEKFSNHESRGLNSNLQIWMLVELQSGVQQIKNKLGTQIKSNKALYA